MSDTTNIQWADSTFSPWRGCTKISPGCANCYIYGTTPLRVAGQKSGSPRIRASAATWKQPLKWQRNAAYVAKELECYDAIPQRPRVFPSLCDWLDEEVPIEWLADFLKLIHDTPNLDWLLLTKRPENWKRRMAEVTVKCATTHFCFDWVTAWLNGAVPQNVWFGVSSENQAMADKRIRELLKIPARVRFVSAEPLLEPAILGRHLWKACSKAGMPKVKGKPCPECKDDNGIVPQLDWVIFGGESGRGARPCNVEWIRSGVKKCQGLGIKAFVKQLGSQPYEVKTLPRRHTNFAYSNPPQNVPLKLKDKKGGDMAEWPEDLRVREFPQL